MATGIPRQRLNGNSPSSKPNGNALGLTLHYEGKRDKKKILKTRPADLEMIWATNQDDHEFKNRLYFGDNLNILAALKKADNIHGKVRLIYIDPPYASGGVFQSRTQVNAYDDLLIGSHYVEFLRERLILMHDILADDGSIYVHLDKNMAFAIKVIMDEIFGPKNFRSWITRKKCNPKNYTSKNYGNIADFILFYSKSDEFVWNRAYDEWTDARALKEYQYVDEHGRRYKKVPIHAPGVRNGETGQEWRGMMPPPGKHWQYVPSKLDELDAVGDIYWSATGNPRRKVYFEGSAGIPVQDIWMDFRDAHNQNIRITGFPTEKNPALLSRIIEASSNPGDLVLDCFSGSGTTLAMASKSKRCWIGIDNSKLAIETTLRRFACGLQPMGDFVNAGTTKLMIEKEMELIAENYCVSDEFALITDKATPLLPVRAECDLLTLANHIQNTAKMKKSENNSLATLSV